MSIKTKSLFYYGHIVDETNYSLDFKEGATTYEADFPIGDYTLQEFVTALEDLLNNTGALDYTVAVDRVTRLITISAPTDFELLVNSGRATSLYSLVGFNGADRTSTNSYVGDVASGSEWRPQSIAEKYIPKEHNEESISPVINESTNGDLEILSFGDRIFIEGNFRYITNITQTAASQFDNDATGIEKAILFLKHSRKKAKYEFMPDRDDVNTYSKVLTESITGSSKGTGFNLAKMFGEQGQAYYETGVIKMRVKE